MPHPAQSQRLAGALDQLSRKIKSSEIKSLFYKPVFIVSAPRSGSTLLFEALAKSQDLWTIGEESHSIFYALPQLSPEQCNYDSGCLTGEQADKDTKRLIRAGFLMFLRNSSGQRYLQIPPGARPKKLHFLEKTPRNALNIPFLRKVFPDARFIFLHRDPRQNISSIMEAWSVGIKDGSFITFPDLPGWDRKHWCMLLPPGWRGMNGKSLAEIAAFQWKQCNDIVLDNLASLPRTHWTAVDYNQLLEDPATVISRLLGFCTNNRCTTSTGPDHITDLPLSKTTITPPAPDKWRKRESEILPLVESMSETTTRLKVITEHHS